MGITGDICYIRRRVNGMFFGDVEKKKKKKKACVSLGSHSMYEVISCAHYETVDPFYCGSCRHSALHSTATTAVS